MSDRLTALLLPLTASVLSLSASAQEEAPPRTNDDPISAALAEVSEDVRVYNEHLVTLASPFMEGRVPGSRGMEIAKEYVEHWFEHHGLKAPFEGESYRQPFELAGRAKLLSQSFAVDGLDREFTAEEDYTATSAGSSGKLTAPAVFVGYSIGSGEGGYTSYPEGVDLNGKIAVMFRFEPMDGDGGSKWSERGWSSSASFDSKFQAAREAGAAGAVIINPPDADDPRVGRLISFRGGGRRTLPGPVVMLTTEAGADLLRALDPKGRTIEELRALADRDDVPFEPFELNHELTIEAEIEENAITAENVAGLVPGKGALKDELVVIGGHLDHLGMGSFGSRAPREERGNTLHPGADDNASGVAALILLADRLIDDYAALDEGADARSVLLIAFSAEESGLNGAFHYAENPIVPIEDHALMINFDMIGRIMDGRLSVSGPSSGKGMDEWAQPFFDESGLDVQVPSRVAGNSDHAAFLRREVPVLFAIMADLRKHEDYHTPGDTSDKINRIDAMRTVDLFHKLALSAATRSERFEFQSQRRGGGDASAQSTPAASAPMPKVRVGISPAVGEGEGLGILIGQVTPASAAEEAGIQAGDILVRWDGAKVADLMSWMETLAGHEPGDEVQVGVKRGGEEVTLTVKLKARDG
ncbi:MAG: M28 family peptidase [Planctomycetota bacterium]